MWLTRIPCLFVKVGENVPRSFFDILKFQKTELGKFIPNFPLKHTITSTDIGILSFEPYLNFVTFSEGLTVKRPNSGHPKKRTWHK